MRKNAGFMILTLLLLTVPALANAWTLAVKVAGGTDTNNVSVAYGTPAVTKAFKSTSSYLYPVGAITITDNAAASSITFDGAAYVPATFVSPTSGNHTLAVTYATTQATSGFTIAQTAGGVVYAQNRNNTWTSTGVTGLVAGSSVPVAIAADANHAITGYSLDGINTITTGVTGAYGQVLNVSATTSNQIVTATFGLVGKVSAALFAPTVGVSGAAVNCSVTATTNADPATLLYSFSLNGGAFSAASASNTYSFTPSAAGTYTVVAQVTSAGSGSFTTPAASIVVADGQTSANQGCVSCHSTQSPTIVANYKASIHNDSTHSACAACHTAAPHSAGINSINVNTTTFKVVSSAVAGLTYPVAKGAVLCTGCHGTLHLTEGLNKTCAQCHMVGAAGTDAHNVQPLAGCVDCHAVQVPNLAASLVNDNNGVRVITGTNGEFGGNVAKKSHHVVNSNGGDPTDAQCAVCHLEGQVAYGSLGVNLATHMVDGKIHLRDGGGVNFATKDDGVSKATLVGGKSQFAWDPANPDHRLMDQFCFSCHNSNGAPNAVAAIGTTFITNQTAKNPFGDLVSNGYDQMSRNNVVNVFDAFNPANVSHHAVRGQKYTIRTSPTVAGGRNLPGGFNQYSSTSNPGTRRTLFEANMFVSTYTPLGSVTAGTVGDNSTLHCGDCHTVGQWKPASTTNALGTPTTVAIGAHGSVNEYMLRNAFGTDALHHQDGYNGSTAATVTAAGGNYVCYLCHAVATYGANQRHNGIDNGNNCNGHETVGQTGVQTVAGVATSTAATNQANLFRVSGVSSSNGQGNVFGYSCAQCHNAGNQGFGGIHGSNTSFTSYSGVTGVSTTPIDRKPYRFMGGLSLRYNGGNNATGNPSAWERKTLTSASREGCYNLGTTADRTTYIYLWGTSVAANTTATGTLGNVVSTSQDDGSINGSWGACGHHNGATTGAAQTAPARTIQRPLSY
jgi:hypothetical protein